MFNTSLAPEWAILRLHKKLFTFNLTNNHVRKLGRCRGVFRRFAFFAWLEFCFCVRCGDVKMFDP